MGIGILVVDQEHTFADAVAAALDADQELDVIAAVRVYTPASCLIGLGQASIVLLDADLPGQAANSLCQELSGFDASPVVIMLSRSAEPGRILAALRSGAVAWVRKDESLQYLLCVIHGVARGETWLPREQTRQVLQLLLSEHEREAEKNELMAPLTRREREVLACLAEGAGRLEVAHRLHLSPNTVRTHLQNLMAKLGVHSTLEAVALTRFRLEADHGPHPHGGPTGLASPGQRVGVPGLSAGASGPGAGAPG